MRACWALYLLLLFFVLNGKTNEDYFGISGYSSGKSESHSVEPDFQIEFNPSPALAFVPARSCHLEFSGDHGTFSPPVLYGKLDINLWCNWTVLAAPGKHIVIYITGFRTNKTCSENNDEIIFEGVSSSVENTIVYACWNKPTHVFAAEASAVSVVLLWRSFSNIGSRRYFDGKYYVFPDPALRPNTDSGNCSSTSKGNVSISDVVQTPFPAKSPIAESHLYSVLAPTTSSTIPYSPEVHSPQEPPSLMETSSPTITIDPLLTATTHEDTELITYMLSRDLSSIYSTSKFQLPSVTQSSKLSVFEGHAIQPTAGDLEPSPIGKWETLSQSIWTWKTPQSEFASETSTLISAYYTEPLDETHLGVTSRLLQTQRVSEDKSTVFLPQSLIKLLGESNDTIEATELHRIQQSTAQISAYASIDGPTSLHEIPPFSSSPTIAFQETSHFNNVDVAESQNLSRTDFIDPHFTTQATDPPDPSATHMLHVDFLEPSLLRDTSYSSEIHTSKFERSQLSKDPTTEHAKQVAILHFSTTHTVTFQETSQFDNVPESQHLSRTDFTDPHFVTAHATNPPEPSLTDLLNIDFLEPSLLSHVLYSSQIHTKMSQFSIDPTTEQVIMPHFSTAHTVAFQETLQFDKANVLESQTLSRTGLVDPHFVTTHATDPLKPSLIHILDTDLLEPSLVSDIPYSSKIHTTKTSHLSLDPTVKPIIMAHFSIAQTSEFSKTPNVSVASSYKLSDIISFSPSGYIEPTLLNVSTIHHIDFAESKPLDITDDSALSPLTVTNNGAHPKKQHFSRAPTIGQFTADSAHLQMPLTKLTLTIKVKPHSIEPISRYPWQVATSSLTLYSDSLTKSYLQSTSSTETYTSVLNDSASPLQVSDHHFVLTYVSIPHSPFTSTKLLTNEVLGKMYHADPNDVKSYTTSQIAPSSSLPPILSSRIRASVLGLQMVQPTYWTTVEQSLDPSFPQSTIVIPDQQHTMDKITTVNEHTSSKSLESQSLPTINYKVTRELVETTKALDWWTVKDLEAADSASGISTRLISTIGSYLSYSGELLMSNIFSKTSSGKEPQASPFQPYLQPMTSSELKMDITTVQMISEGNEKSTYSYQTSSDVDLYQNAVGQPRDGYLDEEDITYFFGNQSLEFLHEPGDSLFVITMGISHKDAVLRLFEKDLIKSVREKITERMIYYPSGANSLILREIRWTNASRVTLTFWLQLIKGGKQMRNFLKTQLKALQSHPLGSSNATLVSFSVEDVNECRLGRQNCHSKALCVNTFGSYSCYCLDGYEDRSPAAPGTLCISSKSAKIRSLSEHLEILIGAIVGLAVVLLLIFIIVCIVHQKRRTKVDFALQIPQIRELGANLGGDHHGDVAQAPSSPTVHFSPHHGREHHTARETASTLELTRITVEQTAC